MRGVRRPGKRFTLTQRAVGEYLRPNLCIVNNIAEKYIMEQFAAYAERSGTQHLRK